MGRLKATSPAGLCYELRNVEIFEKKHFPIETQTLYSVSDILSHFTKHNISEYDHRPTKVLMFVTSFDVVHAFNSQFVRYTFATAH